MNLKVYAMTCGQLTGRLAEMMGKCSPFPVVTSTARS
jgi:hypothetical protein